MLVVEVEENILQDQYRLVELVVVELVLLEVMQHLVM
jgi:hypothetical protein